MSKESIESNPNLDDDNEDWSSSPGDPIPLCRARSFGSDAYAYDASSKWMVPPKGKAGERVVVGVNPGSHECYKVAKERTDLCLALLDQIARSVRSMVCSCVCYASLPFLLQAQQ